MDIKRLQHFLALVETRSYWRAARKCQITPQALSKSIQRLEQSLGVKLFDRDTRSVEPTLFAQELLPFARNIDAESRGMLRTLDTLLDTGMNRLVVGTGAAAAVELMAATILAVRRYYPGLVVELIEGTCETLAPQLLRGQLDVIVSVMTTDAVDELIEWHVLSDEPYRVYARSGHPLLARGDISLPMLLDYPWIGGDDEDLVTDQLKVVFGQQGLEAPRPAVITNSILSAISFVLQGDALVCLPEAIVRRELRQGLLVPLEVGLPVLSRPTVAFFRRNSTRSPECLQFLRELQKRVRG